MTSTITSDNVTTGPVSDDVIYIAIEIRDPEYAELAFLCARKDNAYLDGSTFPEKGLYIDENHFRFMIAKENITPMSTDFIPKNLSVVFSRDSSATIPNRCNVAYDELRGWIENGIPVFAIYKIEEDDGSVGSVINIMKFITYTDSLGVYYTAGSGINNFKYNSDGTFSEGVPS